MGTPQVDVQLNGPFDGPIYADVTAHAILSGGIGITALPTINIGKITVGLDQINVAIKELPKINIGLDPIRIALEPLRCHIPVDMAVCFNLFGHDLASIRFCGEA